MNQKNKEKKNSLVAKMNEEKGWRGLNNAERDGSLTKRIKITGRGN